MPSRDLIVFDIDGTLAFPGERIKLLDQTPVPWDHFFALSYQDQPIQPVCDIFRMYREMRPNQCVLACITGRPERWRLITQQWLRREDVMPDMLFMRGDLDTRKSVDIKAEYAGKLIKDGWVIKTAFEDQPDIAAMWREKGVMCLQVEDEES